MKRALQTRLIHWKKQKLSLLFWLVLPLLITGVSMSFVEKVKEDSKVPVGIVQEEDTELANALVRSMEESPFIQVEVLSEPHAVSLLEKHELDSVFIIRQGYEENIEKGNRNRLLVGMESNLSFAYNVVSEMIISFVQQDAGRIKAVLEIENLHEQHNETAPSWEALIEHSKEIENEQHLMDTTLQFKDGEIIEESEGTTIEPWTIWAYIALLSTMLMFDWIIKERRANVRERFLFTRMTFKNYLAQHFLIYTGLLFLFDLLTMFIFHYYYQETISLQFISALLLFRMMINMSSFILALWIRHPYVLYTTGFAVTLISALTSIISLTSVKMTWFQWFHPIQAFLTGDHINIWLIISSIIFVFWFVRREDPYVKDSVTF
ncbi:ABC transporter permease [Ornithinibacillus sp. 4-3]|uniref:ABC transporter permease n=1 Tax=Ornithinibacillus sp. 4-3 TaxID=3231488 RepID=A0AB39HQC1_9BACI